jgi:hypothetical protein
MSDPADNRSWKTGALNRGAEDCVMTGRSASTVCSPFRRRDLPKEDRLVYRKWARRVCALYLSIIVALSISLSMHGRKASQLAAQDYTAAHADEP